MSSQHFPKLPPPSLSLSSLSLCHLSSSVSVWLCRSQASALNAASFLQPSLAHSPTWHGPTWNSVFFLSVAGGEGAADTLCILNFWQGARSCVSENFVQVLHFNFNFFVPHTQIHTHFLAQTLSHKCDLSASRAHGATPLFSIPERIFNSPLTLISVRRKSLHSLKCSSRTDRQTNANSPAMKFLLPSRSLWRIKVNSTIKMKSQNMP